jgi:signal transduction histidine kinase
LRRTDVDWDDKTRREFIAQIDLETDRQANQMERVLANRVQHAIKYSPPGTPIGVSARITDDAE